MKKLCILVLGVSLFFTAYILAACSTQLKTPTPEISENPLPRSMKGYEIYSWQEDDQWVFKLITGTNRQKSIDEIMSDSEPIQEDSLVNIKIIGVDSLKKTLERVPKDESVFWLTADKMETAASQTNPFGFPSDIMIKDLQLFCEKIGVDLIVSK